MEELGVISPVQEPTPWCAGMVTVPKPSGSVCICVDLKPLNESVMREIHPMPKVDITLAQLKGARVFSKLDTNSGFWQVPLAEKSRLLKHCMDSTVSINYCLESQVPQNTSKGEWGKFSIIFQELYAMLMMF